MNETVFFAVLILAGTLIVISLGRFMQKVYSGEKTFLHVFIAALMIGRMPELLGKKTGIRGMQLAVGVNIITVGVPLILAALACTVFVSYTGGNNTLAWLGNLRPPHRFTTFLYEYVSGGAGNGSGFEALGDNTPFWNLTTSIPMLTGRFAPIAGMLILFRIAAEQAIYGAFFRNVENRYDHIWHVSFCHHTRTERLVRITCVYVRPCFRSFYITTLKTRIKKLSCSK